ncbi:MAG: hypothetical protein EA362_05900, partial [Saprospirales bacterium]
MQAQDCIDIEQIKTDLSNIVDQCSCANPINVGAPNETVYLSNIPELGAVNVDLCIKVFGTLIIDIGTTRFRDCNFIMDKGSQIKIQASNTVFFTGSNLHSCGDYFWDGIELNNHSFISIFENTIQHSLNGIHSNGSPVVINAGHNTFLNNHFAIKISDGDIQNIRSKLTLVGNIFAQTEVLKLHWDNPGWFFNNGTGVKVDFGIVNADGGSHPCNRANVFVGLYSGYQLSRSISEIHNNIFHDFGSYIDHINTTGWAINSDFGGIFGDPSLSILNQSGWPTNHIESIKNVDFGIRNESGGTISMNIMKNVRTGVISASRIHPQIIEKNDIEASVYGILANNLARIFPSRVNQNRVLIEFDEELSSFYEPHGIYIANLGIGDRPAQIRSNRINLKSAYVGLLIEGRSSNYLNIACNSVSILETREGLESTGMKLIGGSYNRIVENTVGGQYSSSSSGNDEVNGIKIIESQANLLKSNYVNNTQIGLHFSNWNSNTMQENNSMANHDVGYFVSETGVTGDQFFA